MSKKPRKKEPGSKDQGLTKARPVMPSGPVPPAMVVSRHMLGTVNRPAKGFSVTELAAAGVPPTMAQTLRLRVDVRRRSTLDANVVALRKWHGSTASKGEKEGEVRRAEEEIAKVAKEVEAEVKKGGARVKKEAKKAEREVAEVVEKPVKSRRRKKKQAKE